MTHVVAGIIERDGLVFICQRKPDQPHPLKWEFPGGKLEAGESPEVGLARELSEELGIAATIGEELMRYEYAYPEKGPIVLIFLRVLDCDGTLENRIFNDTWWCAKENLADFDFLSGDESFIAAWR